MGWVGLQIPHTFLQAIHRHDRRSCGVTFPSVHGCDGPVQLVPSSPVPSRPSRPVRSRPASPVHSGPVPLLPSIPDQSGPSCTVRCRPQSRPVRSRPARPVQRKVNVVVILQSLQTRLRGGGFSRPLPPPNHSQPNRIAVYCVLLGSSSIP